MEMPEGFSQDAIHERQRQIVRIRKALMSDYFRTTTFLVRIPSLLLKEKKYTPGGSWGT